LRLFFFGADAIVPTVGATDGVVDVTTSGVEGRGVVDESIVGAAAGPVVSFIGSALLEAVEGSCSANVSSLKLDCSDAGVFSGGVSSGVLDGGVGDDESGSIWFFNSVMVMLRLILPRGSLYRQPYRDTNGD